MIRIRRTFLSFSVPLAAVLCLSACEAPPERPEALPAVPIGDNVSAALQGDFTRINDVDVLGDSIIVLDDEEVRLFNHDGDDLGMLGGKGAGPGEYEWPTRVRVDSTVISVVDLRLSRITSYVGQQAVETRPIEPIDDVRISDFVHLADWGGLAETAVYMHSEAGSHPTRSLLLVHDNGGIDTLATYRIGPVTFRDETSFGFLRASSGSGGGWAHSATDDRLVIVSGHVPTVRWWRIGEFGLEGPTIVELPVPMQRFDERDREALVAQDNEVRAKQGSPALSRTAQIGFPEYWGQIGRVVLTEDGECWVHWNQPRTDADSLWFVVDLGTSEVQRVELPRGYNLMTIAGDQLYGYRVDEYDVPSLSILRRPHLN